MTTNISEPGVKKPGRPPTHSREYLNRLRDYYHHCGRPLTSDRSVRNKADSLRAIAVLFGDKSALLRAIEAFPPLRHLADPSTGHLAETLLARLGRIRDDDSLIQTAIAVCAFKADSDCDFEVVRNAWEVAGYVYRPES